MSSYELVKLLKDKKILNSLQFLTAESTGYEQELNMNNELNIITL